MSSYKKISVRFWHKLWWRTSAPTKSLMLADLAICLFCDCIRQLRSAGKYHMLCWWLSLQFRDRRPQLELNTAHASCQVSLDWSTCSPWLPLQSFQTLWLLFSVLADYFASDVGNSQCICNEFTNLPKSVPILLLQRRRNLSSCPKLILSHVFWVLSLPCANRQEVEFNWQIFHYPLDFLEGFTQVATLSFLTYAFP